MIRPATLSIRATLSILVLFGFGSVVYALLRSIGAEIPPGMREILMYLFGVISTQVNTIIQYWFGSSQSSTEKSQAIAPTGVVTAQTTINSTSTTTPPKKPE